MSKRPVVSLPDSLKTASVTKIINVLTRAGGAVRFVGGCVRDAIDGRTLKDIDLATTLTPKVVMDVLMAKDIYVVPTGIDHGTVMAIIDKQPFEITTLRKDLECYGRHAKVEYTTDFEEDAKRRDFTINAMSLDADGTLYDYFNGYDDLQHGIVRFVGNASDRIQEDYLRILRFFRFQARYGKHTVSTETFTALKENIEGIEKLSGERIQTEMFALLSTPHLGETIISMFELGVLQAVQLPCTRLQTFTCLEDYSKSMFAPNMFIRLVLLIRACAMPETVYEILDKRWRLSRKDSFSLRQRISCANKITEELSPRKHKHYLREWGIHLYKDVIQICVAEWLATHPDKREAYKAYLKEKFDFADSWEVPVFPLRGQDLLDAGIKPGKQLGLLLKAGEAWWEEQDYTPSYQEVIEFCLKKSDNDVS